MTTNISAVLETRGRVKELERLKSDPDLLSWGARGMIASLMLGFVFAVITNSVPVLVFGLGSFIVFIAILVYGLWREKHLENNIKSLKVGALKALEALERNLPAMLTRSTDGAQGYASDLAYKLLSKWLKLEHPDGNHAHLREYVLATQIGLALIALHHPSLMCLGEDGLPEGRFSFENVRDMGPCSLKWKLSEDGKVTLRLDHPNPKGGAGWGTVIA